MNMQQVSIYVFFISLALLLYTYIGYGLLATLIGLFRKKQAFKSDDALGVPLTVIIPAYNEAAVLIEKTNNTLFALKNFKKAQIILITDGSNDGSAEMILPNDKILYLHSAERKGKSAAINKAMENATGDIIIITDANAMVNETAFEKMVVRFQNKKTGAVSGEKKVMSHQGGSTGGEGLYWKYESYLKRSSARMYSLTGAAGELLAFRKSAFQPLPPDTILDDLVLSLNIIKQKMVIDYEPAAYATEPPSKSIGDEFKRKVRISAGVFQTLFRNLFVFNPFKHFVFVFQFNSHRVLRWIIGIACILLLFISNGFLIGGTSVSHPEIVSASSLIFFNAFFVLQCFFYFFVLLGLILRNNKKIPTSIFLPFYFIMMNTAVVVGFFRFLGRKETVLWEKAAR